MNSGGKMNNGRLHAHALHRQSHRSKLQEQPPTSKKSPRSAPKPSHINPQHRGIKLNTTGLETEIRRDYLHEYYVIISPNRGRRPYDTPAHEHPLIETADSPRLDLTPALYQIKDGAADWAVKVVANKYPALTPMNPKAYGAQEIVIDTPLSNRPLGTLTHDQFERILATFQERLNVLKAQKAIEYVLVMHNDGYFAGASLAHAHSQIMALPVIPPKLANESADIERYWHEKHADPFEAIISYEQGEKKRVIWQNDHFIAFCPYASQWPFEAWILPRKAITSFTQFNDKNLRDVANILKKITSKLCSHDVNYNFYLEEGVSAHHRFCLKVCGRTNIWGGLEVGTGMIINTVPPESAAEWYRG